MSGWVHEACNQGFSTPAKLAAHKRLCGHHGFTGFPEPREEELPKIGRPSIEDLADALYRLPGIENASDTIEVLADNLHALLNGRPLVWTNVSPEVDTLNVDRLARNARPSGTSKPS